MHQIKYALFYDSHTSPPHPDGGKNFDAEKLTAGNFELSLKLEKDPGKVFSMPGGQPLKWQRLGDHITFTDPEFTGFGMVAVE